MKIKNVLHILREVKYQRSVLKKYSGRMVKGEYILLANFRTLSLKNSNSLDFANLYLKPKEKSRMAYIAGKFNRMKCFVNRNKKTTEEYDLIYTSNNFDKNREVKLFSSSRKKKILVICTSPEEKEKQLTQFKLFKNAYNMPSVKDSEYYPNAFEISMILLKKSPEEKMFLEEIYRSTVAARSLRREIKTVLAQELIGFSYNNDEINLLLGNLYSKINKETLTIKLPLCTQHGDLSKKNILYGEADGKTDFWWIDWEHARERVFFYDYFFYIIHSAFYYDTTAYDLYMSGEIDEMLKNFFNHFGVKFEPEKRKDYLLIFMIEFLKERVCDFGRVSALREYCDFLENH